MGRVMIRCPVTRRAIATGIETDAARFNSTPAFFALAYCPFCRTSHRWFARDAWVCDATSPQQPTPQPSPGWAVKSGWNEEGGAVARGAVPC